MKKISLYLDEQLWHQFRIECVKRQTSASQAVAGLLVEQMQRWHQEEAQREAAADRHRAH